MLPMELAKLRVHKKVRMYRFDTQVTGWINSLSGRSPVLDLLMLAITWAGIPFLVLAVAAQWWSRGGSRSQRHATIACGLSFLLGLAINQMILLFVHRMRPYDAGVTH